MFLENGFQAFLPKPIDVMRLDALLNEWIRDKRSQEMKEAEDAQEPEPESQEPEEKDAAVETGTGFRIDGLDMETGCSRFGGEDAYKEIMRSYAEYTPKLLDKLREVREETLPEYAVAVHGLKGSSYGVCAEGIGKMAEELEFAAKRGDLETVRAKNGALIQKVEALLSDLRSIGKKPSCGSEKTAERRNAPDPSLLRELRKCCAHYDVAGMEKALSELERYTYESQDDLVKWLRKQVDDLEYGRICECLEDVG